MDVWLRGICASMAGCVLALSTLGQCAAAESQYPVGDAQIEALAARFAELHLAYDPTLAYFTSFKTTDHSRFPDRGPHAIADLEKGEDSIAEALNSVPATQLGSAARANRAVLNEILESHRQLRVCRAPFWELSHLTGWQVSFARVADAQPVQTADERAQALVRWASLPRYLAVQTANLRLGLKLGYSVPKTVVRRVVHQLDALVAPQPDHSPFFSMATRSNDARFGEDLKLLLARQINPAVRQFRRFLSGEYLPQARESLAISGLPNGASCYQALLRSYTTTNRTAAQIMAIGEATVAENEKTVIEIGSELYGARVVAQIIHLNEQAQANHFSSEGDLLASIRDLARGLSGKLERYFVKLPDQAVIIEAAPEYQMSSGMQAHYEPQPDVNKAAKYIEPAQEWRSNTRGAAEVTLVHETMPGHHLQVALARELARGSRLGELSDASAYTEGWARYAERLAEEAAIYQTDYARISRRVWPARGMVLDPGIHAFGWSRQKAISYLRRTGLFDAVEAEAMIDRIAVIPGQLTAYDTGGLEFLALRSEAQQALGTRFDIAQFHQRILEQGIVPLHEVDDHVRAWIRAEKSALANQTNAPVRTPMRGQLW